MPRTLLIAVLSNRMQATGDVLTVMASRHHSLKEFNDAHETLEVNKNVTLLS